MRARTRRRISVAALVVLAALAGIATPAAAADPAIEADLLRNENSVAGTTDTRTVQSDVSNASASDPVTVVVDASEWPDGAVGAVNGSDVQLESETDAPELVGGPTVTGERVTFAVNDTSTERLNFTAKTTLELSHPLAPEDRTKRLNVSLENADAKGGTEIRLDRESFTVTATPSEVGNLGDRAEIALTLDSDRTGPRDVVVEADGFDAEALAERFQRDAVPHDSSDSAVVLEGVDVPETVRLSVDGAPQATYRFSVTSDDTGATATSAPIEVTNPDESASFESDVFETEAGEFASVSVSFEEADDGYVMIGGDTTTSRPWTTNFFDVLYVGGDADFLINTRVVGSDVPSAVAYPSEDPVVSYLHNPDADVFDDVTLEDQEGNVIASELPEIREAIDDTPLPRPLQPERYRLVASADGTMQLRDSRVPEFERPLARSNLLLTQPSFGNVTFYTAPRGSANDLGEDTQAFEGVTSADDLGFEGLQALDDQLTERDTVAEGDRLVVEIEATGVSGLVQWLNRQYGISPGIGTGPEVIEPLTASQDGIVLDSFETNPSQNQEAAELDLGNATDGDIYLVPENTGEPETVVETYYLVVDTRDTGPFDGELEGGDEFAFDVGYTTSDDPHIFENNNTTHFPYADGGADGEIRNRSFSIETPEVAYDRTNSRDEPIVTNATDATIAGTTNIAPATDVTIQLIAENRSDPTRITVEDVEIGPDGRFEVTEDLSPLSANERVEIEFYRQQQLLDKRPAVIVTNESVLPTFEIISLTNRTTVTQGETLANVSTTIFNDGSARDRQPVRLQVGNATVDERSVTREINSARTFNYSNVTIDRPAGEYNYTVRTNADNATGRLVVEAANDTTTEDPPDDGNETTPEPEASDDTADQVTDPPIDPSDDPLGEVFDLLGMIPIGTRDVVAGAAAVGAIHVLGHWA